MKKLIGGLALGLVVGAGAVVGALNIPSVNSALSRVNIIPNNSVSSSEDLGKDKQIADLETENSTLKSEVTKKDNELTETKTLLASKEALIEEKENEISSLNSDVSKLTSELNTYKSLVSETDKNYIELISNLEVQLNEKTIELNTANAQLSQLQADKTALETRVEELEKELAELKEELKNYKSFDVDTLNVASFNGVWYKNSTFEDYYTIEDGIVTHNLNEDKGVVQNIYNQMYLIMNSSGGLKVNLYDDGMKFVDEDGTVYTKYYINTTETLTADFGVVIGDYSYASEIISLNGDNTLTYSDGSTTSYGAYTAYAVKRNIGGNESLVHYITATINVGNATITKDFKIVNYSKELIDIDSGVVYICTRTSSGTVLSSSSSSNFLFSANIPCIKITVRTKDYVTIPSGSSVSVVWSSVQNNSSNSFCSNYTGGICLNGVALVSDYSNGAAHKTFLYNSDAFDIKSNTFVFYFYDSSRSSSYFEFFGVSDITSVGFIESSIINVEIVDNSLSNKCDPNVVFLGKAKDVFNSDKENVNYVMSNSISDYYYATYSNENLNLVINEDGSTVTLDDNDLTSSYEVLAYTDGVKIYHTITVEYTDSENTRHTLILNLENNNLVSSTLDEEDYTLTKK